MYGIFESFIGLYPKQDRLIVIMEMFGLIVYILWYYLLVHKYEVEDEEWSNVCASLMNKIESNIPAFQQAMGDFAIHMVKQVQSDGDLLLLANSIPSEIKMKAERDYCNSDIDKDEFTINLLLQLRGLKKNAR